MTLFGYCPNVVIMPCNPQYPFPPEWTWVSRINIYNRALEHIVMIFARCHWCSHIANRPGAAVRLPGWSHWPRLRDLGKMLQFERLFCHRPVPNYHVGNIFIFIRGSTKGQAHGSLIANMNFIRNIATKFAPLFDQTHGFFSSARLAETIMVVISSGSHVKESSRVLT
jgi:hypothetical protein